METPKRTVERGAAITILLVGAILAVVLLFRYLLGAFLPFLFGLALALAVRPLAARIAKKSRLSVGWISIFTVLLLGAALAAAFLFGARRILGELGDLLSELAGDGSFDKITSAVGDFFGRVPVLAKLFPDSEKLVSDWISHAAEAIVQDAPAMAASFFGALPRLLFSVLVFLFSAFYFCVDGEKIRLWVWRAVPERWSERLRAIKEKTLITAWGYLRVYLILTLVTFLLLVCGFGILGVPYAWLFAFLLAVFDLLPILGVGTVVIPWGIVAFLMGNRFLGFGLWILYAVILIVRRVLEPRLIGERLGMHPLPVLFFMYGGYVLFGVLGMLVSPPLAVIAFSLFAAAGSRQSGEERKSVSHKSKNPT